MFTGIVERVGTVQALEPLAVPVDSTSADLVMMKMTITDVGSMLVDVRLGDSIAVNGRKIYIVTIIKHPQSISVSSGTISRFRNLFDRHGI
jgi:riboflavin synthase alpha subunit